MERVSAIFGLFSNGDIHAIFSRRHVLLRTVHTVKYLLAGRLPVPDLILLKIGLHRRNRGKSKASAHTLRIYRKV